MTSSNVTSPLWTSEEIAKALSQSPGENWSATGVSIDSRTLQPGDIFVALRGDSLDGHDYISQALSKGAVACIVDREIQKAGRFIHVPDTLEALNALARFRREQTQAKIIALTGSVGKTTTKEFIAQILPMFGLTNFSHGTYNNCWGVPLSLARMNRSAAFGVFEIGTNHPGEILPLTQLVRPHIAVITLISEAHIGFMGSQEAIAEEKGSIFLGLEPKGQIVLNKDDKFFSYLSGKAKESPISRMISFGTHEDADVRLLDLNEDYQSYTMEMTFSLGQKTYSLRLPFLGHHRVSNVLAVMGVCHALGLSLETVCSHIFDHLRLMKGRGPIHCLKFKTGNLILIDDAYNANPTSMRAAFNVLKTIPKATGRHIVVLGEMGELGDTAIKSHKDLASLLEGVDMAFSCGQFMRYFQESLPSQCQGFHASTAEELIPIVEDNLWPGDILLVKGSKSSRVSLVVDALLADHSLS